MKSPIRLNIYKERIICKLELLNLSVQWIIFTQRNFEEALTSISVSPAGPHSHFLLNLKSTEAENRKFRAQTYHKTMLWYIFFCCCCLKKKPLTLPQSNWTVPPLPSDCVCPSNIPFGRERKTSNVQKL